MKVCSAFCTLAVSLLTLVLLTRAAESRDKWAAQLPEGEGKVLVMEACIQCHTLESTVLQRKNRAGWQKTVNDMILRGAFLTPTEAKTVIDYLSQALAPKPIDLNRASLDELLKATPLQREEAEAILRYRSQHGPFRSVDDLKKVKELKPERLEKIKNYLTASPVSPLPASESRPN